MAKVNPHIDHGTAYVQLSKLPFDQAIELKNWLPMTSIVNMNTTIGPVDDAIQYSEYEYWFDFHYANKEDSEFEI